MAEVVMQADSVLHPHAVLGSAGFGYVPENGEHIPIPQVGTVVLGEKAEVGAGSTVDRATAGSTVIGRGTKLDNLVMVGHNCQIGEHCILVSQVGLGGSSILGDRVIMAGQSGMADHTRICDGAVILSRAAVTEDVTEPGQYSGFPARSAPEERRSVAAYRKLPDLLRRVRKLEKGGTD
jgi:UDP-3-O-[3-hydroxymyristoyl] glucosamine N-acyltransferase